MSSQNNLYNLRKKISNLNPNRPKWQWSGTLEFVKYIFGDPEEITPEHKIAWAKTEQTKMKIKANLQNQVSPTSTTKPAPAVNINDKNVKYDHVKFIELAQPKVLALKQPCNHETNQGSMDIEIAAENLVKPKNTKLLQPKKNISN